MEDLTISTLAAAIVLFGAVVAVLVKAIKPILDNQERMADYGRKLDNDNKRIENIEELQNAQSLALIQMMTHMIDGNHVDQLRAARDDLQRLVITGARHE